MRRVAIGICLLLTLFIPVEAEPTSTGGIVISEVLVSPNNENFNGTDWNGDGVFGSSSDQYIELWNSGDVPISLANWTLDDEAGFGSQPCIFGSDVVLDADERGVIYRADSEIMLSYYYGDEVNLFDADGQLVDNLSFGANTSDFDLSLYPNGSEPDLINGTPTPGAPMGTEVDATVLGLDCQPPAAVENTIFDLQSGNVSTETSITLTDVVVTSPNDRSGNFFIQENGGGEYSGIYVYLQGVDFTANVGDALTITGEYVEYYDLSELKVTSVNDIVVTGTNEPIADTIDQVPTDWESWEGCLISLSEVEVTSSANNYGEASLSVGLMLDDAIYNHGASQGDILNITGLVTYSYGTYKLIPRSGLDLLGGDLDNLQPTVAGIQQGIFPTGTEVTLNQVVVTADVSWDRFFIQDQDGGSFTGITVETGEIFIGVNVGDVINITGQIIEHYGRTQLNISQYEDVVNTGQTSTAVAVTISSEPDSWEPYEGVLIRLQGVKAVTGENTYGEAELSLNVYMDDQYYDFDINPNDQFASITGVLDYNYGKFTVYPRDAADLEVLVVPVDNSGQENDNSQNQQENQSIDEEDENNLDVDPTKRDVSSSTNDEQDAGALLLVLAVTGALGVLIGLGLYSLNKSGKEEELVEGALIEQEHFVPDLPTGPPPKEE